MVAVQAPTAEEHLAILGQAFPQLSALLPAGMAALSLVKTAAGQSWDATDVRSTPSVVAGSPCLSLLSASFMGVNTPGCRQFGQLCLRAALQSSV